MSEYVFATAQELAIMIRQRQVSAREVLEAHLAQIARHNAALNAIVTLDEERARAHEADAALDRGEVWGPLHGVPMTIKDAIETAGVRTTSGHPPLADYVPKTDAPVVARLHAAGAVLLGKTNLPQLAADFQTDNPIFGRSSNPWDLTRTPGGSTGGGAAAVAAGLTPLEIGSDLGGSVRIPASYCGICALKPTENRVPLTGHIPELPGTPKSIRHMASIGPLARSVGDLELALRLIAGPDGRQWEVPPAPLHPAPPRALQELRLAWLDAFDGFPLSGATRAALARFASELERSGCRIERCAPQGFDFAEVWETWGEMLQAEIGATMSPNVEAADLAAIGATVDSWSPAHRGRARLLGATVRQYVATLTRRDALIAALEQFLEEWDALLCPATASLAIPHCPGGGALSLEGQSVPYGMVGAAYTCPFNLTGHPAVVLPLALSDEGLPIGLQVVGRRWGEMELLAVAARLVEVIGPFPRPPGY